MRQYILPIIALACVSATAQTHPTKADADHSVSVVVGDTAVAEDAYSRFAEIAPAAFNVPSAPRFAFVGKDRKFYLGIGGTIKGTASYDFGDPIDNANEFTTSAINMHPTKGNDGLVQFSGQQSGLFANFIALPGNKNQVGVYIQGNFLGEGYGFQLQYAYAKWRGFTVGYDFSLFTDAAAAPPTIDYEGPNALTAIPNAVVDYRHAFNDRWSMGIGAELPQASYTNSATTYTVNQRIPDIPAYIQMSWGGGQSWLRLSGILRNMAYRNTVADKNENVVGWGIKMSGSASLAPGLTAYYQGAYGKGLSSYFQDINGAGLDLVPENGVAGKLVATKVWGGYTGLQYNFSPKAYMSATYSHVRNYADRYTEGSELWGNQYKYAQYAVGNVFYNVNSVVTVGLEYIWGRRVDQSGLSHHDNRIQAMLQVNF